jgi:hypothetical protein
MSNGTRTGDPEFPTIPPRASMARTLSFVTAGGAAPVGLIGCCLDPRGACYASLTAGTLALLSLVFNLWDFYQNRQRPTTGTGQQPTTAGPS